MAYIGKSPSVGIRNRFLFTATSGQTTFSGADDDSRTLSYTDAKFLDIYLNGVLLDPNTDYTATTGTSVVLAEGAATDDLVEIIAFDTFSLFDGTFEDDVTVGRDLSVTRNVSVTGSLGVGVANPSTSLDVVRAGVQPLRIESTSGTEVQINMVNTGGNVQLEAHSGNFNIDADAVGIGNNSPSTALDVTGTITSDGLTVDGATVLDIGDEGTLQIGPTTTVADENQTIEMRGSNGSNELQRFQITNKGEEGRVDFKYGRAGATPTKAISIGAGTGDISFYEDTGTTAKLFWDASAEALGIGTTSPTASLDIPTGGIRVNSSGADTNSKIGNFGVGGFEGYIEPYDSNAFTNIVNTVSSKGITFQTGGSERWRIQANGNLKAATNGIGIDFSASEGSGASSSVLDDYEEGTWTPTYFGATTVGTTSYTFRNGTYTKIGNLVHATAIIGVSSATGTGNARIGGLPFTSLSQGNGHYPPLNWSYNNGHAFTSGYQLAGYVSRNDTIIVLSQFNSSGAVGGVSVNSSFTEIDFSVTYHTG
jgi:hypothetical protein